ncbi:MAG: efflux RND transporter periplasmic adaptor subunit [Cyclobacteriaceae bacterium]|nr:efflux RND transporter periplasmic adaptor subunit [Cyclobacteriaceae bacterium HetDA_MAG_MS6]
MKAIKHLTILASAVLVSGLLTGCGKNEKVSVEDLVATGDLNAIRAMKKELSIEQKALAQEIAVLDSVISASGANKNLPLVTTIKAEAQDFNHYVELQGDVTTKQNVLIYPEAAGTLVKVRVIEGQKVSKGQLLATIDNGGMSSQLLQMKTQLDLAKTTFERQERLWEQKIGSEIQFLQAKTSYESQENAVKQMESQLAKYSVRAPFSGIIDDIIKDQGTVVAPGGPGSEIFRIVNLSNMYVEVSVPESYIADITPGKSVKVHFPILGETIQSTVRQTGNFINPDNRSFTIEIPVPNYKGKIKPNLTARVQINDYRNENAILIPQSIISENADGEQYAFVASGAGKDNIAKANKNIITTGKTQGDFVEVLSGISNGQRIIQEGARSVKDGQQVKILTGSNI